MSKQFLIILAVIVLGLFGVLMLTNKDKGSGGGSGSNSSATTATEHIVGKGEKNVTIVEYGDFQCPACALFHPIIKQIKADYGDQIKFQFRHFPLVQIHPNAYIASRAAEAAGKQGKFFEMHDLLYEQQDSWKSSTDPTEQFVSYASQLGLNTDQLKSDMQSEAVSGAINADLKAGKDVNVNSTPTFFINGRKIDQNPQSLDDFKKIIDEEIAKSSQQ